MTRRRTTTTATEYLRRMHYTALSVIDLAGFLSLSDVLVDVQDDDPDLAAIDEQLTEACDKLRIFVEES